MSPHSLRQLALRHATLIRTTLYFAIAIVTGWATFTSYSAKLGDTRKSSSATTPAISTTTTQSAYQRINFDKAYGKLPLSFEANTGQTDPNVKYFARGPGYNIFFTPQEAVLVLPGTGTSSTSSSADDEASAGDNEPNSNFTERQKALRRAAGRAAVSPTVVRLRFDGADATAGSIRGDDQLPGKVNYFFGNDSSKWTTDVATYGKVSYSKVYPGVDLVYYGNRQQLEYDLIVAPGADPGSIQMAIDGTEGIRVDRQGNLILKTKAGELQQLKPHIYQEVAGVRKEIKGSYVLRSGNKIGFRVARYDRRRPLIIDPILKFLSFVNGSGEGIAITADPAGNTYFTGVVFDANLNPTPGAYQIVSGGGWDAFVTKLNSNGSAVFYTTFLGGSGNDYGNGIEVDASGNAYIAGGAGGPFPTTAGAIQTAPQGYLDSFITKLNPTGSALIFSTLLGGNGTDEADNLAFDANGSIYVGGLTGSTNLPVTAGAFSSTNSGGFDGYVAKINATATAISYLTYVGGGGFDYPVSMKADASGNVYLGGQTTSLNFPTQTPIQPALGGPVRGLFKTSDGGANWGFSSANLRATFVYSIAIDRTNPAVIFIGTDGGIYKSTNAGANWTLTGPIPTRFTRQLLIDPTATNTIYAGTGEGVFKSTDGGNTWLNRSTGLFAQNTNVDVRGLALHPSQPNTLYAALLGGTYKTIDGGLSWTPITTGLTGGTNSITNAIVVDPSASTTAYIAQVNSPRVFKTVNGGASWTPTATGIPAQVLSLAIHPTTPQTVYASTAAGVYRTTNGGTSWSAINNGMLLPRSDGGTTVNPPISCVTIDPTNPSTLYAAANSVTANNGAFFSFATVFKSIDGGANWTVQSNSFNNAFITFTSIAVDPVNPANVYAGSFGDVDGFVFKLNSSGNGAVFSTYFGGDRTDAAAGIALDSSNNVYIAGIGRGFGFPTTAGAFQTNLKGAADSFVAKINAAGNALVYSTYLGGTDLEFSPVSIAIDATANAYVTGSTQATDFPVTPGAFQTTIGNPGSVNRDVFVTKLNPAGSGLVYSSYLGGDGNDSANQFFGNRLALDAANNAYILGVSSSTNFPVMDVINYGATSGRTFVGKIDGNLPSHSISGRITTSTNVPIPGVSVEAESSLRELYYATTDAQGYYTIINLIPDDYVVTPQRYGSNGHYIYAPPSRSFPGLNSSQTANFTATQTYDIIGQVTSSTVPGLGIFDVTINLTGSATAATVTDANGQFAFRDLTTGNYTVTPSKPGFTFNPVSIPFNALASDQFPSFTTASATFLTISGRAATPANVAISNATVSLSLLPQKGARFASTTTDTNGNYSFPNLQSGGNYTLLIAKPLLAFTPQNPTLTNLSSNQTVNFTSAPLTGLIGKIAFVSNIGLGVMNADTTGESTLLPLDNQCSSDETAPSWSPDGSKIAFARCDTSNMNLYSVKPDGTGLLQVTSDPVSELFPSWSPEGNQLTFTLGECSGTDHLVPEIFASSPSGSDRSNLTNTEIVDAYSDWSPNGSRIVFSRAPSTDCSSAGSVDADLYTMRSTGGSEIRLTNTASAEISARYAPDGSKIAFVRDVSDPENGIFNETIFIMNSDGTNEVQLTPNTIFAFGPTWSPDGSKLAFQGQLVGSGGSNQIFVINADGTGLAQLTTGPAFRESPAWQHYSISGHITGNTDGPVTMVLAGTLSRVAQTNANGDYVFGNLTPGGNYSVTPVSTAFTLTPAKADINNLVGNQIADFTVQPPIPTPTPPLTDDFSGVQRDPARWNLGTLTQPMLAFDPQVSVVQQNGQLVITPRTNVSGLHYNGYVSVNSFDFNNATATVRVTQVASGGADTIFAIGSDLDNFTRFVVREGGSAPDMYNPTQSRPRGSGVAQLIFQVRIGGQLTSLSIPYNATQHAYFRFRHDPLDNAIVFETSPNNKDFTEQHRVVLQRSVSALTAELSAGTSTPTNPGSATFDSFQLVTNTFQFGPPTIIQTDATAGEGDGRVNLTITRIGSSATAASVEFITRDTAGLQNCNVFNGVASSRCDYATSIGTVVFGAGQTAKTISVPLVDDGFAEGLESFTVSVRNASGAGIGTPSRSVVNVTDNDSTTGPNPIDTTPFFVRQQYVDFLSREPDPAGFAGWQQVINNCPPGDTTCDRIHVSSAFFRSAEFQGRGYFIYRFYPVAYGRKPDYSEFMPDLAKVSGFLSDQQLEAAKVAFIAEFMSRQAFKAKFDSLNDTQYVDALLATAGVVSPHRDFWIAALGNGTRTRATVLRDISESIEVYNKYFNQAFVVMQYFGYLRRDPDAFYLNWIEVLDTTGDFRGMVNGFSNSLEYRFRFGP